MNGTPFQLVNGRRRRRRLVWLTLILLLASGMRLYGLNHLSPPGLSHDEVANWLIDRSILDEGNHAVYYPEAYGHEAGFHYLQAGFIALLGDNALALRLPAAFLGILLVAVVYRLAAQLLGPDVALLAAAWQAALLWPVMFSRQALRGIMLPVLSGFSAYFWWRAFDDGPAGRAGRPAGRGTAVNFILAGGLAGLSLYTYMAARAVPIFYALFILYLALFHRPALRSRWRGVALFAAVHLLVALPLALYLQANPAAEFRISEVDAPLRALRNGDFGPALANSWRILGMFGIAGDPLWRQNVAGWPVFAAPAAVLFYASVAISLGCIRNSRHAFLLLWLFTSSLPSIVTIDAPSSIRILNALPVVTIFPAQVIHSLGRFSTVFPKLSTAWRRFFAIGLLAVLLLWDIGRTVQAIFIIWPANDEVQFVWQAALTNASDFLDRQPAPIQVAIGGWTPESMDPPTMAVTLRRRDLALRYFNPTATAVVPAGGWAAGQPLLLFRPTLLPLAKPLETRLLAAGATAVPAGRFTYYRFDAPPEFAPQHSASVDFGGELRWLGYDLVAGCGRGTAVPCQVVSYWQVLARPAGARRLFLHLVDEAGRPLAQHDGLDAPAEHWQPGDLLLQLHPINLPDAPFTARMGVYQPPAGPRLAAPDGADAVFLPELDRIAP